MNKIIAAGIASGVFLIGGCSGSHGYGTPIGPADTASGNGNPAGSTSTTQKAAGTALFQVAAGILPYPTDLYFVGSTDGTLNIPAAASLIPFLTAAVNALDGFSTNAVIRERFEGALNPASFTKAAVIMVPVITDNETKATTGVLGAPLTLGTDFSAHLATDAEVGPTILELTPLHPLMPSTCISKGQFLGANCKTGTGYLVILTNAITDASGNPAVPDADYAAIKTALVGGPTCPSITDKTLNGVCQLTGAHLKIAQQALGINPANIVLTFSFTTESTVDTLELISATASAQTIKLNPTPLTTAQANPLLPGHANVWVGALTIPYYLSKAAPLTGSWQAPPFPLDMTSTFVTRFNPLPVPTQMLQIPVLITVPNAKSTGGGVAPAGGWPVLIFEHGITANREEMFGVADSFADAGFVVAAIDLPLHGITTPYNAANPSTYLYATGANPLYAGLGLPATGSIERTFDLELITPGVIDPSGSHFINLTSPLTERDNLREGVADLITLARSLPGMKLGTAGVNAAQIHLLAHSLGASEGSTFMAVVGPGVSTATLASPPGNLTQWAQNSPTFAPLINAGLAAQGLTPGMTLYAQFFRDAQSAIDSGDPINYIALATAQHPIHMLQVVGSTPQPAGCNPKAPPPGCTDQVVPNSDTQALITASAYGPAKAAGALTRIAAPAAPGPLLNPTGFRAYVNFLDGDHSSIVDNVVPAVTAEMQGEAISFAASNGQEILVSVPGVIQP
ncbi:MAG TPA: alpha/beta fold hydrolase [Steroidobacteraceae bacterium]|nr:alpha/beta fold hydrolase [Steroidobacteraceae bacterium]